MTPPDDDAAFARWLAVRTGRELLALRARLAGAAPQVVRAEADRRAHESIVSQLARWRSGEAVLPEEQEVDDPAPLTPSRVWIVHPPADNRRFGEPRRAHLAVHIALWERGRGLVAGAVALPAQDRVLATDDPPPYPPPGGARPLRIAVSRTRAPRFTAAVAADLGAEPVPMGSAGA